MQTMTVALSCFRHRQWQYGRLALPGQHCTMKFRFVCNACMVCGPHPLIFICSNTITQNFLCHTFFLSVVPIICNTSPSIYFSMYHLASFRLGCVCFSMRPGLLSTTFIHIHVIQVRVFVACCWKLHLMLHGSPHYRS